MVKISKSEFMEMFQLGIICGNDRNKKCWHITSKQKGRKCKNRYISEYEYNQYQNRLRLKMQAVKNT